MKSRILIFGLVLALLTFQFPAVGLGASSRLANDYAPDDVLVKFKPSVTNTEADTMAKENFTTRVDKIPQIRVHSLRVAPGRSLDEIVQRFRNNPR